MEKRYKVLRIIGTIYKILGLISLIITILLAVGICAGSIWGMTAPDNFTDTMNGYGGFGLPGMIESMAGGFLFSLVMIINGLVFTLTFYALGEGIYLFLALEENTRTTAELLKSALARGITLDKE